MKVFVLASLTYMLTPWLWIYRPTFFLFENKYSIVLLYVIMTMLLCVFFRNKLAIKTILLLSIMGIVSYEFFEFLFFEIQYQLNAVHFGGTISQPKDMYRDYKSYIDFMYIKNFSQIHINRLFLIPLSIILTGICVKLVMGQLLRNGYKKG